jgi:hypothetical protein
MNMVIKSANLNNGQMDRARDRLEVVIRVHAEDGQVYTIRDPKVLEDVKEYTEKKVEAIDWKQQPHHDDDEDVYILDI